MKLKEVTGHHLREAYAALHPAEAEFVTGFESRFESWLTKLREGDLAHQLSLGHDYTGRKTRALLMILDLPEPATLPLLIQRLGLVLVTPRERMQRRAARLRKKQGSP